MDSTTRPNPFATSETIETYYGEFIDSLPFGALVNLLAYNIPRPLAWMVVASIRVSSWVGRPTLPTAATASVGNSIKLPREEMPARPMSRWAGKLETLTDIGFETLEFVVNVHIGAKESASVLLIDSHRSTFLSMEWFRMPGAEGIEERTAIEFNSILRRRANQRLQERSGNATIAEVTTLLSRKSEAALQGAFTIDGVDTQFLPSTIDLRKAYQNHCERLNAYDAQTYEIGEAVSAFETLSEKRLQWMLSKGYMKKLTPKQIEIVKRNVLEPE